MFIEDRDIHFLSKHQANALLALCKNNVRMKVLMLLMLDAGLRVSEVIVLNSLILTFVKDC